MKLEKELFITGHNQAINILKFSNDGNILLSGSFEGLLIGWSVQSKSCIFRLQNENYSITSIDVSMNGNYFLVGSKSESYILLFDLFQNKKIHSYPHRSEIINSFFFNNTQIISCTKNNIIYFWDVESEKCLNTISLDHVVSAMILSNSQQNLAIGYISGEIDIWSTKTKKCIYTFTNDCSISYLDFSYDDQYLISIDNENISKLWFLKNQKCIKVIKNNEKSYSSAKFHPDNVHIYFSNESDIIRYDFLQDAWDAEKYDIFGEGIYSIALNSSGDLIATAGEDRQIHLFNQDLSKFQRIASHWTDIKEIVKHPKKKIFASIGCSEQMVLFWNFEQTEIWFEKTKINQNIFFNKVGDILIGGYHPEIRSFPKFELLAKNKEICANSLCFSNNGNLIIIGDHTGHLFFIDTKSFNIINEFEALKNSIQIVRNNPKTNTFFTVSNTTLHEWSYPTLLNLHELILADKIKYIECNDDGTLLLVIQEFKLQVIDLTTFKVIQQRDILYDAVFYTNEIIICLYEQGILLWHVSTNTIMQISLTNIDEEWHIINVCDNQILLWNTLGQVQFWEIHTELKNFQEQINKSR